MPSPNFMKREVMKRKVMKREVIKSMGEVVISNDEIITGLGEQGSLSRWYATGLPQSGGGQCRGSQFVFGHGNGDLAAGGESQERVRRRSFWIRSIHCSISAFLTAAVSCHCRQRPYFSRSWSFDLIMTESSMDTSDNCRIALSNLARR